MKTNAARLLDRLGVRYELRDYEVDPEALDAETVAAKIRLSAEQVFKTLVARGDRNGICLAVVPGTPNWTKKRWPGSLAIEGSNWFRSKTCSH